MVKPGVLMQSLIMPYLRDSLESKFVLYPLWEQSDKEAYVMENAESIRAVVTTGPEIVDAELIRKLPKLEIVASFSVGLDKVDLQKCKERGIAVTNTPDVVTDDTADLAIALLLASMRHVCAADRFVRKGCWPKLREYPLTYKMSGKCLGIVGLGRIGSAVAKRAEAFGCKISYFGTKEKTGVPYKYYGTLLELAKNSDVLVLTCPLTKETTHIVGRIILDALGPNGFLVNIARGAVVDEQELIKALIEGRLGGAGLDVYEKEPRVPKELWNMDNVVLSPHLGFATWDTTRDMADLVVSNLEAHFEGKPLLTPYK
ncbi:unnamed protein product [Sphagnum balticum]